VLRSLRALLLFWTVFASYGVQWVLTRTLGRRRLRDRLERVHRANARRLADGFTRLRGVFIKMGQVLSVVGTFLPKAFSEELSKLQDQVPPRPYREIEPRLKAAFGSEPQGAFARFEPVALAAASLAQVHRAELHDGTVVAVKILYPGVEELIRRDLQVLRWVLPLVRIVIPVNRVERVLDQLGAMLSRETDYAHERENMARLRAVFSEREHVIVPDIVDELSREGVLTMTFETGVKINDFEGLSSIGVDSESVAKLLVECYVEMLLKHRVFHADPHPGNFLVRPGPALVILDYGAVEEVTSALAAGMKTVVFGAITRNDEMILRGIEGMGFVAEGGDRQLLAVVGREYLKLLANVNISDLGSVEDAVEKLTGFEHARGRLREIMRSVQYPDGFFYVERTLLLLFGLVAQLAPRSGLPGLALPYATRALAGGFVAVPSSPDAAE
jgi:predicted unusual protein kinase regulating ubiquinone biosynthesis (AarF/ABC1/UbiB family)